MKTAVITGSSRGIGKATAEKFAKNGFNVVVCYNKSKTQAEELVKQLNKSVKAICVKVDMDNKKDIDNLFDVSVKTFGKIDVLVNNAGVSNIKFFADESYENISSVVSTNLTGLLYCSKKFVEHMLVNKFGHIVNVSSMYSFSSGSMETVYTSTKAALVGFTKSLAKEIGPSGIFVNAVAPGAIDTDMTAGFSKEDQINFFENAAIKRMGKPEEIANVIYFLCSNDASYINGQTLLVDGGVV